MRATTSLARLAAGAGRGLGGDAVRLLAQIELGMDRPQGLLGVFAGHQHRDLDLAGGDHLDVDALLGQGAEHPLGHAGLRGHAQADDRNLGHLVVAVVAFGAQFLDGLFDRPERVRQLVAGHREGDVGPAVGGHVLRDHVHGDVLGRDLGEDRDRRARPVGHAEHGHAGLVLDHRRAADRPARRLPAR